MKAFDRLSRCTFMLGLVVIALLVSAQPSSAKGNFTRITIQLAGSTTIVEPTDSAFLSFWSFSDFSQNGVSQEPHVVGPAYEIKRGFMSKDGKTFLPWDHLLYYHTSPENTLGRGWVYYEGLINGSSEYDGRWFMSTRNGDALMESIIFPSVQLTF